MNSEVRLCRWSSFELALRIWLEGNPFASMSSAFVDKTVESVKSDFLSSTDNFESKCDLSRLVTLIDAHASQAINSTISSVDACQAIHGIHCELAEREFFLLQNVIRLAREAIKTLNKSRREIFRLRFVEKYTFEEIARVAGLSVDGVTHSYNTSREIVAQEVYRNLTLCHTHFRLFKRHLNHEAPSLRAIRVLLGAIGNADESPSSLIAEAFAP